MTINNDCNKGIIVKALSGFYYVDTGSEIIECKARGVFKKNKLTPLVGDEVEFIATGDTPVIYDIAPRKNMFERPPVSNVSQFIIVSALKDPVPNLSVIDKFLVKAESSAVSALLCFNKADISDSDIIDDIRRIYEGVYPLIFTQALNRSGVEDLLPFLKNKASALVGPSGVGKSTLINSIKCEYSAVTGEISEKNRRGKNTTRHTEMFALEDGGWIFDTPGFTSFDVPDVDESQLQYMFPEFEPYIGNCRFNGCRHLKEPDCSVRNALIEKLISIERYDSYRSQLSEIRERQKKRY